MSFDLDFSDMQAGLDEYVELVIEAGEAVLKIIAEELRAEAESGHPWTDRSGDATRGLQADAERDLAKDIVTLWLAHGDDVFYGIFLEAAPGTRDSDEPLPWKWSVIMPVLERNHQRIMAALQEIFS